MKKLFISLALFAGLISQALAADNYAATAGAGLTFGAKDAAGILYSRFIGCDNTTVSQCWAVDASGRLTALAVQSGTWTVQPGNTANTTPWLMTVNQGGNSAIVKAGNTFASTDLALGVAVTNTLAAVANNADNVAAGAGVASPVVNYNYAFDGTTWDRVRTVVVDPCEATLQTYTPISITTATTTRIVAPSASNKTYICSLFLTSAAADNIGIVEGTGGTCGAGTAGVIGGTTAANGPNFAANGGVLLQAGGKVSVAQTAGTNVDLCLITSAATPLAGGIKFVQAP